MDQPLTKWRCDVCSEWVSAEDGYVIWKKDGQVDGEMLIIHRSKCDDKSYSHSNALSDFLGPDGLAKLTAMLSYGFVHWVPGGAPVPQDRLPDLDVWTDFVRRVQIPYYEESRAYLGSDDAREQLGGWNEVAPYIQDNLTWMSNRTK